MRSKANNAWKNVGCSAQSVPSLSNTAMRSAIGTNFGESDLVTVVTNSTIDRLARPSFHEGSESVAWATFARSDGCFMLVLLIELDSPLSGFSLRWKIGKLEN